MPHTALTCLHRSSACPGTSSDFLASLQNKRFFGLLVEHKLSDTHLTRFSAHKTTCSAGSFRAARTSFSRLSGSWCGVYFVNNIVTIFVNTTSDQRTLFVVVSHVVRVLLTCGRQM